MKFLNLNKWKWPLGLRLLGALLAFELAFSFSAHSQVQKSQHEMEELVNFYTAVLSVYAPSPGVFVFDVSNVVYDREAFVHLKNAIRKISSRDTEINRLLEACPAIYDIRFSKRVRCLLRLIQLRRQHWLKQLELHLESHQQSEQSQSEQSDLPELTLLERSIKEGNIDLFKFLVNSQTIKKDSQLPVPEKPTPLMWTAFYGRTTMFRHLLSANVDLTARDAKGRNVLFYMGSYYAVHEEKQWSKPTSFLMLVDLLQHIQGLEEPELINNLALQFLQDWASTRYILTQSTRRPKSTRSKDRRRRRQRTQPIHPYQLRSPSAQYVLGLIDALDPDLFIEKALDVFVRTPLRNQSHEKVFSHLLHATADLQSNPSLKEELLFKTIEVSNFKAAGYLLKHEFSDLPPLNYLKLSQNYVWDTSTQSHEERVLLMAPFVAAILKTIFTLNQVTPARDRTEGLDFLTWLQEHVAPYFKYKYVEGFLIPEGTWARAVTDLYGTKNQQHLQTHRIAGQNYLKAEPLDMLVRECFRTPRVRYLMTDPMMNQGIGTHQPPLESYYAKVRYLLQVAGQACGTESQAYKYLDQESGCGFFERLFDLNSCP